MPQEDIQAKTPSTVRDEFSQSMIGRVVDGDFEIRREIGRGGMGTVFEAWQKSLERVVAVKILHSAMGLTPTSVERFRREAQAAAKLHHTNIVPIHAQGEHQGIYYYAMELVRGQSVHDIICQARGTDSSDSLGRTATLIMAGSDTKDRADSADSGSATTHMTRPSPKAGQTHVPASALSASTADHFDTIARLTATVAEALEYAHQAGVIHRDIKPHNLILGDDGRLCITDFGLARVLEQPGMTMTGEFIGSPLYMSPEQISGGPGRVDHRTDVYSLGTTLYEWLTLSPPFPGQTRELVVSQIMTADPPSPRSLNPMTPTDLETICCKAIAKDPAHRYQNAAEMAADLRRYLERSTIKARRAGPIIRIKKYVKRHPVGVLLAVLAFVVLMFGGAWYKQRGRSLETAAQLESAASDADQARHEKAELAETQRDMLDVLEGLSALGDSERAAADQPTTAAPSNPLAAALSNGEVLGETLRRQWQMGLEDSTTPSPADLDSVTRGISRDFSDDLRALLLQAERQRLQTAGPDGELNDIETNYLHALMTDEDQTAMGFVDTALAGDPAHANARFLRALILCRLGRFQEMVSDAQRVLEARVAAPVPLMVLGAAQLLSGDSESAVATESQALELQEELTWAHALQGVAYARLNDMTHATQAYNKALVLDTNHVVARRGRAEANFYLGSYDMALMDADKLVELTPEDAEAQVFKGRCHDKLLQFDQAIRAYNEAIRLGDTSLTTAAKLVYAMANAREQQVREQTQTQVDIEAPDDSEEPEEGAYRRPLRDTEDANWINRWIRERLGGQEPPPTQMPDLSGYPWARLVRR